MAYSKVKQTDNEEIVIEFDLVEELITKKFDALEVSVLLASNAAHDCEAAFSQERMIEWLDEIKDAMYDLRDGINLYLNGKDS